MRKGKVKDIMTPEPVCATPQTELPVVAQMMKDHDCGEIPIIESQGRSVLIGVITDRDIVCRAVAAGKDTNRSQAGEFMSTPAQSVTQEMSIEDACELMERYKIRRIPVVDGEDRCIGIVSQADIARNYTKDKTAQLVKNISQ